MSSPFLLRHGAFLRFWLGQTASSLAYQMLVVGIGWQMYDLTDSALSLGLIGLAQFVPQLLLTLVAGHVADQYNRRVIVIVCRLVLAGTMGGLVYANLSGQLSPAIIYVCGALMGATRAFESPATQALLPNLITPDQFPRALALTSGTREATVIAGPALGGLVYLIGASWLYGASVVFFLVSALVLLSLQYEYQAPRKEPASLKSLFSGIHFIRDNPVVLGAISLDLFSVLLGGATALLPIVARDILHTGSWGLGLLRSAPALGALLMSIWLARFPLEKRVGKTMFYAVALFGLATIVFGLSQNLWLSMGALLVLGASDMVSVIIRSTLIQLETPDAMRGRVSAVNYIFIGTSNQLGEFESGITAAWFGVVPAIIIGGIGTLAVVALWMKVFPALTHRDKLSS
ncbi:MFS transporter [Gallaecimonas pentaromativorans]|uniref:Putative MFS family arabinose efflux permease n=1 Tax=Gallaecimonas pentaromativorans TaxID=584787 RepID=A0A3N1P9F9_9GAMM|nr:MFS transporter [Gallaecimonas pentaromativorans]ROQ23420.1 putative MFS family arabinose efflux permease [Gallaecimonas pentaromativorans]